MQRAARLVRLRAAFAAAGTLAAVLAGAAATGSATPPWPSDYPDESGYQERIRGMVGRIAAQDYLARSMSRATCPDTGLPFLSWALAGETIPSPYTGRSVVQGDTGYFGPKRRTPDGRISHFGGDPLKVALPPAAAVLLLAPPGPVGDASLPTLDARATSVAAAQADARVAAAYLSIPGNLAQQYHFAAVNWTRFLPLAGDRMPPRWHDALRDAVAAYEESRRPSDGPREYMPLPRTENLVGLAGEHLGGGGTENHKTMWRSAGLLYAQLLPGDSPISRIPRAGALATTSALLGDYARRLHTVGSGEYDSSTYYPYTLRAFLNLHDFSPDPATRAMARAVLDEVVATYALKVFNGVHTGPQRRGWSDGTSLGEMERHLWAWAATDATATADGWTSSYTSATVPAAYITTLHQATSTYRPHARILRLLRKEVPLPFEARIFRADYGMTRVGAHAETFYCDRTFALGSTQLDRVNNAGQQTVWSLSIRGTDGSLQFGGGQPRWRHPEGHSPYDQLLQSRGALLLMAAPTETPPGATPPDAYASDVLKGAESYSRLEALTGALEPARPLPDPGDAAAVRSFMDAAPRSACTWFFASQGAAIVAAANGGWVLEGPEAWVVVRPFGGDAAWLDASGSSWLGTTRPGDPASILRSFRILVVNGFPSGFAVEAVARTPGLDPASLLASPAPARDGHVVRWRSHAGDDLELRYRPDGLRPSGRINGSAVRHDAAPGDPVIDSPVLRLGNGRLWISDGSGWTETDFSGPAPSWTTGTVR